LAAIVNSNVKAGWRMIALFEAAALFGCSVAVWSRKIWPLVVIALVVIFGTAAALGTVQPVGIGALAAMTLLAWLCNARSGELYSVALHGAFFVIAVLLTLHLLPGFQNPVLLGPVTFTPDAVPFKMYLNFDKSAVGFALLLLYRPLLRERGVARALIAGVGGAVLALLLTLPVALALGAVRWEPKYPEAFWLWALNNLLLVALAEEALFRGFLQTSLSRWFDGIPGAPLIALSIAAMAFGALHYGGGAAMIVLAALAGVAYGLAYRYGGLLASMTAHFGLNTCHILLFTYPLLASG
jgi:CAAX protease family protein